MGSVAKPTLMPSTNQEASQHGNERVKDWLEESEWYGHDSQNSLVVPNMGLILILGKLNSVRRG